MGTHPVTVERQQTTQFTVARTYANALSYNAAATPATKDAHLSPDSACMSPISLALAFAGRVAARELKQATLAQPLTGRQ